MTAGIRQFSTYVGVGVLCAIIDVGLMMLLIGVGTHHLIAASIGFSAGLVLNYLLHANVTFKVRQSGRSFIRYLTLVFFNYLMTLGFIEVFVVLYNAPLTGKLVSLPVIAVTGFLLGRIWVFRA